MAPGDALPAARGELPPRGEGYPGSRRRQDVRRRCACAVCHKKEAKTHRGSRHALTLRPATLEALGSLAPQAGAIPQTGFVLIRKEGRLAVGSPGSSDTLPLDLALGSGKTGVTYVAFVEPDRMVEMRQSYFPSKKGWYATPGQEEGLAPDDVGKVHPRANIRQCVACHAVTLPEQTNVPPRRFFGVGCEACHGPGSAHVAASQAGDYERDRPEHLARLTGAELGKRCGVCHGQVESVAANPHQRPLTNRFQVYGLTQSACFKQSGGALSCVTCHDPHADAGHDPKPYEAVCVRCHSVPAGRACPVQPKTGCVACHMPSKPAIPGTALPTLMADHWIRAKRLPKASG